LKKSAPVLPNCFHDTTIWKQKVVTMPKEESTQWVTGAPEEIRTPDPQIRSLATSAGRSRDFCKPGAFGTLKRQRVRPTIANRNVHERVRDLPHIPNIIFITKELGAIVSRAEANWRAPLHGHETAPDERRRRRCEARGGAS